MEKCFSFFAVWTDFINVIQTSCGFKENKFTVFLGRSG
jgi:hypothetical protein